MQLRRIRRPTMLEALQQARAELGPQALVLATRMVPAAGWRGWMGTRDVEITAAVDPQRAAALERAAEMSANRPMAEETDIRPFDFAQSKASDSAQGRAPHGSRAQVVAQLEAIGVDRRLALDVADAMPGDRRRGASLASLRRALADRLGELAIGDEAFAPIEVFVGPPGVGKTTTVAKVAAQQRARHGVRLGLVAADGYRVGAVEQLRLYADIIGAPFVSARTAAELDRAIVKHKGSVLVDTAGRSPNDPAARELFDVLAGRPGVRTHLLIAAGTGTGDVQRVFDRYAVAKPDRVVLTKIDETESVSPLVSVLRERRLPISYLTNGQRVPDDIERATAALLAACVLGEPGDARKFA